MSDIRNLLDQGVAALNFEHTPYVHPQQSNYQ